MGRTAVYNHFQDKEALLLAFITYETGQYSIKLKKELTGVKDPIKKLRIYIREQLMLGTNYHLAPGMDLRRQVSSQTGHELHSHASIVENILREILRQAIRERKIPLQNLPVAIGMINSTLALRQLPEDKAQREYLIHCIQTFILRALGVDHQIAPLPDPKYFFNRRLDIEENPLSRSAQYALGTTGCPIHQSI